MSTRGHRRPTMRRAGLRSTLVTVVVLMAAGSLTGCSGDAADGASGSPSSSSTASSGAASSGSSASATARATGVPPEKEKPPATPPARRGRAGQQQFARHVMDLWAYSLRTDDSGPLTDLSPDNKPCRGCARFAASMTTRREAGWTVDLAGVRVRRVNLTQQAAGRTYSRATVDIPRTASIFADGTFRSTNQAHRGATFEVLMRFTKKKYQLLAFTVS